MEMSFPKRVFLRPKHTDFNLHRLKVARSFKEAPGSEFVFLHRPRITSTCFVAINVIEQKQGVAVFGSACIGGLADVSNGNFVPFCPFKYCNKSLLLETPSPYNRPGSLIVRSDSKLQVLDGHKIMRRGEVDFWSNFFSFGLLFLVDRIAQILYSK